MTSDEPGQPATDPAPGPGTSGPTGVDASEPAAAPPDTSAGGPRSRRRPIAAGGVVAIVIAVVAALLAAASGFAPAAPDGTVPYGVLRPVDGGTEITIPALWAGRRADGTSVGGLEAATVWVGTSETPGFTTDLSTVEADGAGPAWLAASASAAVLSTLYSGTDPATASLRFGITGPIDGPSAGAILTVGALAARLGVPLKPGISMTGTISPDGSIGGVAGVPTKIEAAAAQGFHTVLIPVVNRMGYPGGAAEPVDLVEWGTTIGVEVIPTADVGTAYETFTGRALHEPATEPYVRSASLRVAGRHTAATLLDRLDRRIAELEANGTAIDPAILADRDLARAALVDGDAATAYGRAVDCFGRVARIAGEARVASWIATDGIEGAKERLTGWIDAIIARAGQQVAIYSDVTGLGLAQQASMPAAMGWITYADAVVRGQRTAVPLQADDASLVRIGAIVAEQEAALDAFFPDAVTAVVAMSEQPQIDPARSVPYLSGYTDFLVAAGDANLGYVRSGLGGDFSEASLGSDLWPLERAAIILAEDAREIPGDEQTLAEEVAQSADALSYYIASASLVTEYQAFGMSGFGLGEDPVPDADTAQVQASVDAAAGTVATLAATLQERGIDPGYSEWSSAWGTAIAEALTGTPRETAGAVLGLNELWYDAVTVLMLDGAAGSLVR